MLNKHIWSGLCERLFLFSDDIIKETGINNVRVMELDLSDLDSVRKFAAQINEKEPQIHVLVRS